jgi:tetratricopeptide (TPR) repeat protein
MAHESNLPEAVSQGLLILSREAIARKEIDKAAKLLEMTQYLVENFALKTAPSELHLQAAEIAIERRAFEEALGELEKAEGQIRDTSDFWRLSRALFLKGRLKIRQREFPEAVALLKQAMVIFRRARASRDPARVEALIALGTAHGYLREFPSALRNYEEALRSEPSKSDPALRGRALWGLGLTHRLLGNHDVARDYLMQAKEAMEIAEELLDLTRVLKNLGELFLAVGKPTQALQYLHRSLRVMERLQKPVDRASTLTEIGRANETLGKLEEAKHFAGQALDEAVKVEDPVEVAEAQIVLARVFVRERQVSTGVKLFNEAIAILRERKLSGKIVELTRDFGLLLREVRAYAESAHFLAWSAKASLR